MDFRFSAVGLIIGILVGLTGMGGASLLTPILILIFKVPPLWAVGTDIAYSTVTKGVGSIVHFRLKNVDYKVALWLAAGSVPAIFLSVLLVQYIRKHYGDVINGVILHSIGFTLLLVAILLVLKPFIMRRVERRNAETRIQEALAGATPKPSKWQKYYRPLVTVLVGAVVGFLVGLTSVGSGTLIIVSLAFLFPRLTAKELVGTDIFQAFMLLASGAMAYFLFGTINWQIAGLLLIGSLPGVFIGSRLTKYVPEPVMRPVLATVLAISGFKLI